MKSVRQSRLLSIVIGVLITVFWVGMMFSLVKNKIMPQRRAQMLAASSSAPSKLTQQWTDFEEYMVITYNEKVIGSAYTGVLRGNGDSAGYTADFKFGVSMQLLGMQRKAMILALADLDSEFNLSRFHIVGNLGAMDVTVTGAVGENDIMLETKNGTEIERTRLALDRKISFLEAVRPVLTRKLKIKPGSSMSVPVIDPVWSMERGSLEVTVLEKETVKLRDREVTAYRMETKLNDLVSTSWVDEHGMTLKRQLVGDLYLERATENYAKNMNDALKQQITIPVLDANAFEKVPIQPLDQLGTDTAKPLNILGQLFKAH